MKIWMLRVAPEPFEPYSDPLSLHLTRDAAERAKTDPAYRGMDLVIEEWETE